MSKERRQQMTTADVRLGVRIEFIDGEGGLRASVLREDLLASRIPVSGECFAPAGLPLGPVGHGLVGLTPEISSVEHYAKVAGTGESPLAVAVIRVRPTWRSSASTTLSSWRGSAGT